MNKAGGKAGRLQDAGMRRDESASADGQAGGGRGCGSVFFSCKATLALDFLSCHGPGAKGGAGGASCHF
jgi:hypothetical protein